MAIIQSYGALTTVSGYSGSVSSVSTSGPMYDGYRRAYGYLYRTQPAVRTVIDFFSRNIAQLGLQVFERRDDDDRVRLRGHGLTKTIRRPNPSTTRYRLIESTVQDVGIYANAYWLKVRTPQRLGLVRIPSSQMGVKGGLLPSSYVWTPPGIPEKEFATTEIVHFRMFDPESALVGFPMLETLRAVLAEEAAASDYRRKFWKNSARVETVIERPANAPPTWDRQKFREDWQQFAGARAGMTPVLEDGMTLKLIGFNAKDSQYLESRKLSREEVAAAYHVPLPMVGILDHATFSNIREQHKQLYQDCLGPWLVQLEEEIELQLLPEFSDADDVYVEFNIAEKLKGSFEEQTDSLSKAIGRPWMTPNEGRARVNLPRDTNPASDQIAEVAQGQARTEPARLDDRQRASLSSIFSAFASRQTARLMKDAPETRVEKYAHQRWSRELASDLAAVLGARAEAEAARVTRETFELIAADMTPWTSTRIDAIVARLLEADHG